MTAVTVIAAIIIATGILGLIVPVLPGLALCVAGVLLWASEANSRAGWLVFAACAVVAVIGWIVQYTVPNRSMRSYGVAGRSRLIGVGFAAVGFFVIPVVGLFLGFVLGVFLAEFQRLRNGVTAWASTKVALKGVLLSVGIELAAAVLVALIWGVSAYQLSS